MFSSRALKFAVLLLLTVLTGLVTRACRPRTNEVAQPTAHLPVPR